MDSLSKLQQTQSKTRELVSCIIKYVTEQQQMAMLQDDDHQRLTEDMRSSERGFWTIAQLQAKRITEKEKFREQLRKHNDAIAELKRENLALHEVNLQENKKQNDHKDKNDVIENEAQGKKTGTVKIGDEKSVEVKNEESSPSKDEKSEDIEQQIQAEKEKGKIEKRKQQKERRKMTQKIEKLRCETKKLIQENEHFKRKIKRTKRKLRLAKSKLQEEERFKNELLKIGTERKRLINEMQSELENFHLQKNQRHKETTHPNVFRRCWMGLRK